jgi:hypothetical protein
MLLAADSGPALIPPAAVGRAASGWLASPATQSRLYQLLATSSAALALGLLLAPAHLASFAFQHATDPVVDAFVRSTGAALLASATTSWILKVRQALPACLHVAGWSAPGGRASSWAHCMARGAGGGWPWLLAALRGYCLRTSAAGVRFVAAGWGSLQHSMPAL